jgi:hypothetical protein
MTIVARAPLFSWREVDVKSDMERLEFALHFLPDEALLNKLEMMRGRGRNEFPIRPMWNAIIAGVVFQHASIESLRRELARNPSLMECCGFSTLPLYQKPRLVDITQQQTNGSEKDAATRDRHWFSLTNLQHIEFMRSLDLIFAF